MIRRLYNALCGFAEGGDDSGFDCGVRTSGGIDV